MILSCDPNLNSKFSKCYSSYRFDSTSSDSCILINQIPSTKVIGLKIRRGQKVIFTKNAVTRSCHIARPWDWDSNVPITLRRSTYVIGSKVNLMSFGVTGVKSWLSLNNVLSPLCYIVYLCYSCICISLTRSTKLKFGVIWGHRD